MAGGVAGRFGGGGALPLAGSVAVAKIWASGGVRRVVQTAQHLHGGFGADTDYLLHRYHAWAKQLELSLGPAAAHEETLGDLLATHPCGDDRPVPTRDYSTKPGCPLSSTTERPLAAQICMPPSTFTASMPCWTRYIATWAERPPLRQIT